MNRQRDALDALRMWGVARLGAAEGGSVSASRPVIHPAKPRKPRFKACEVCQDQYEVRRLGQRVCEDYKCAIELGKIIAQAARLKKARKEKREYRAKTMSLSKLKNLAQKEFNRYCRERDYDKPCISSGKWPTADDVLNGHQFDAGHYRSIGAAAHLRFHEDNVHKQLVSENRDKSGNVVEYRKGLIARIGLARVEALENDNEPRKWTREELIEIRRKYLGKWKALRAEREARG